MSLRSLDLDTEEPREGDYINITVYAKPGSGRYAMLTYELIGMPPSGVTVDKQLGFLTHAFPPVLTALRHHMDGTWQWGRHVAPGSWRDVEILRSTSVESAAPRKD
jgi:hypothetical protein